MKLKHLKLKGYRELIDCFFIRKGAVWTLCNYNSVDFTIDGMILIQNKFILNEIKKEEEQDYMKEKIYNLKVNSLICNNIDFNKELDNTKKMLNFLKDNSKLIGIKIKRENSLFIGKIIEAKDKSVYINLLSISGLWLNVENFKYNEIRVIIFNSDYINSFELLLKSEKRFL